MCALVEPHTTPASDASSVRLTGVDADGNDQPSLRAFGSLNSSQRWLAAWYWSAVLVSVLFVLALPIEWYRPDVMPGLVGRMQLTEENTLGAWWSGILLMMLAFHAYDARVAEAKSSSQVGRAWTILASIFLFLSADEVGSIHERLSLLGSAIGVGSWGLLIPLGGVLGALLFGALYIFWKAGGEHRRKVWPLTFGFLLLGSVAVQEVIEHAVDWGTGPAVWIRAVVEEGTELLGMVLLLAVVLRPAMMAASRAQPGERGLFKVFHHHPRLISLALLALIPVATIAAHMIEDNRGRVSSWLTILALVIAALQLLSPFVNGEGDKRIRRLLGAALCIVGSMVPMWFPPTAVTAVAGFSISTPLCVTAIISLLVYSLLIYGTMPSGEARHRRNLGMFILLFSVWMALALGLSNTLAQVALATQLVAFLTLVACYLTVEEGGARRLLGQ
ncbi:MAG: hypothetical protein KJO65_05040 [Gemmatimonadetes bacterium]|nr:hypothetical protein [Gemmatimonadota bacterium]